MEPEKIETPLEEIKQEKIPESVVELSLVEKSFEDKKAYDQNEQKMAGLEQSVNKTQQSLNQVREGLGIPSSDEKPPSIATTESRIEELKVIQEEMVIKAREKELREEIANSFNMLAENTSQLEDDLRRSRFNAPIFEADTLRTVVNESGVDFKKANVVFDDMEKKLKRGFVPDDPDKKMAIDERHYGIAIDALENLEGNLSRLRRNIDHRKTAANYKEFEELSKSISRVINSSRRNKDFLEEMKVMRRRLSER